MEKKIIILLSILFIVYSCDEEFVNTDPLTKITDSQVWQDENLVNAFISNIYQNISFQKNTYNMGFDAAMGAEYRVFGPWQEPYSASTGVIQSEGASPKLNYWKYQAIREANEAIINLQTISNLDATFIKEKVQETRFLRAYIYFEMVKRYGGVPILTEPQNFGSSIEELSVPRNSEQEVYDFVINELDAIIPDLPEVAVKGRPSKWAALALQSRAALYAASIGQFSEIQLDGLLGVTNPDSYWDKSYKASKKIITESNHTLYNNNPTDKAANFQSLFIEEDNNPEVIFSEVFDGNLKGHNFSNLCMPDGFNAGWGSNFNVFLDMVELFDFEDGSSGKIPRSMLTSHNWSPEDLFGKRDPRFRASVFYPESPWQGSKVLFHTNTVNAGSAPEGWINVAPRRNRIRTGFHLRKRLDEATLLPPAGTDDTDYIVFRLGETYLNLAEAAFYLGKTTEALDALNEIRKRAGMPEFTSVDEDKIRHERQVELFAEDHRYWDLRRWRIAVDVIDGLKLKGLRYIYDGDTRDYKISILNAEGTIVRVFKERNYYLPIRLADRNDNQNLIQNPGYTD